MLDTLILLNNHVAIERILTALARAIWLGPNSRLCVSEDSIDTAPEFFFLSQLRFLKLDIETSPRCSCCPPDFQYPAIRRGLEFFISILDAAKIRSRRALRQIMTVNDNVVPRLGINEATVRALDTLVIADCPVTRFGWIKSRVRNLRGDKF